MRDPLEKRSGSRGAGFLGWTARLLVGAGAALLVWCALLVVDARLSQRVARQSLEAASVALAASPAPVSGRELDAALDVPPPAPSVVSGSAIADLSIPRLRLSAVVLHGSNAQTLRRGPGHLENTALPGEQGNSVIAGHRDSFFWPLRNVRLGDDVFVDTPHGRVHYRVASLRVVDPHDVSVLESSDEAILTLITCYPFQVLGHAPFRFVVQAVRVDASTAPAFTARTSSPPQPAGELPARDPVLDESVAPDLRAVFDDETLVREAIERFRLTYNARLINHGDARPGGALTFETCAIDIAGDQAAATCGAPPSPDDGAPHTWTMTLERANNGWAIRLIETT